MGRGAPASTASLAQGWQAGGHRGGPVDTGAVQLDLLALVSEVARLTDLPIMGTGGVMTGADAAEVLRAGTPAVAFGTAFLDCPEGARRRCTGTSSPTAAAPR